MTRPIPRPAGPPDPPDDALPVVWIASVSQRGPSTYVVTARARDDVALRQVEFFVDQVAQAVLTRPPYTATVTAGADAVLTVAATDSAGQVTTVSWHL